MSIMGMEKMKIAVTILLLSFLWVSCKSEEWPYTSCKSYCKAQETIHVSREWTRWELCHRMKLDAYKKAQKRGYCYNGPLIKGIDKEAIDPDPDKCEAAWYSAQQKCELLPPDPHKRKCKALINDSLIDCEKLPFDPSMLERPFPKGMTVYDKDGQVFRKDGKPVINGKVCICD